MIKPFGFSFTGVDKTHAAFSSIIKSMRDLQGTLGQTQRTATQTGAVIDGMARAGGRWSMSTGQMRGALTQFGQQAADTAVVLQMGQHPLQAFVQQGSQMLAVFGPAGALLGGVAAVVGTLGLVAIKTGGDLSSLANGFGPLLPAFSALAEAARVAGGYMIDTVNLLVNNLDRLVIAASVTAGFFAARWVAAFVAAGGATSMLTGALALLRGAMIRLPFVALVVAATELIYQFVRLVQGAGSFGEALSLVKDVGSEAFARLANVGEALRYSLLATAARIKAGFVLAFADIVNAASVAASAIAGMFGEKLSAMIGLDGAVSGLGGATQELVNLADKLDQTADAYAGLSNAQSYEANRPLESWKRLTGVLSGVQDEIVDVRDLFTGSADAAEGAAGSADKAANATRNAKDQTSAWLEKVKEVGDGIRSHIGNGLMEITRGTKSVVEGFRDMATDIIAELYRVMVVERAVASISGAIDSLVGGLMGATTGIDARGPMPRPVGRAVGGPVQAGVPYMVGENNGRRGELFIPGQNGTIASNPKIGGDTVIVNQTINVSTGVVETVRHELAAFAPQLVAAARGGVMAGMKRGRPA